MEGVSMQFSTDQSGSLLMILLRIEFLNIILLTLEKLKLILFNQLGFVIWVHLGKCHLPPHQSLVDGSNKFLVSVFKVYMLLVFILNQVMDYLLDIVNILMSVVFIFLASTS